MTTLQDVAKLIEIISKDQVFDNKGLTELLVGLAPVLTEIHANEQGLYKQITELNKRLSYVEGLLGYKVTETKSHITLGKKKK